MPSRRAVVGVFASALLSGCAGRVGTSDPNGSATVAERRDGERSVGGPDGVGITDRTGFERPAVETPVPGSCSPAARPTAADGAAYPSHPGDVTELTGLRFARRYEVALAENRILAETPDATAVGAEAVDSGLKVPGTDEWYVASVTVESRTRLTGETRGQRSGGTYYLTDEVAMRADGASALDGEATDGVEDAVVVACA